MIVISDLEFCRNFFDWIIFWSCYCTDCGLFVNNVVGHLVYFIQLGYYLCRCFASRKLLWRPASRCHAVCVSAALVAAAKVMCCIQCSVVWVLCFCCRFCLRYRNTTTLLARWWTAWNFWRTCHMMSCCVSLKAQSLHWLLLYCFRWCANYFMQTSI